MSEPFDHLSGDLDYWMGLDLLDACYDPMPVGMDLGGRPLLVVPPFVPPNIAKMQGGWQDIEKNPTDFNVPPDTDAANFSGPLVESDSSPGTTGDGLSSSDYKKQHTMN
ncbi:hypothetical protein M7I_5958 [Glarea lozoyensis 74030]|uniref:Uncharacterized protein n=1 Tax=Glarea lozoyensis (strain ATCC 74030 / MF5533) TaxID=1104152 RepID=H0ET99_GLAL7|nr:hypothetical protein M7I_5958 [Glarea lozoyensis 74030]